jgi:hypothetical protein
MTSCSPRPFTDLETNRSPQGEPETQRLPRAAQLPPITGLPCVESPTTVPNPISFEPDGWITTPMVRRPSGPLSNRVKFLIATAVAVLPAGYLVFGNSDRQADVAPAPQAATDIPPGEWQTDGTPATAEGITIERPEGQTRSLEPMARVDKEPTASSIEARTPRALPKKGRWPFAARTDAANCFPSASAVRLDHPGGWPSWTLRAPGHEGVKCWYVAKRTAAHDHRIEMQRREIAQSTEKAETSVLFGLQY